MKTTSNTAASESAFATGLAGASSTWRKLLLQAEIIAPYAQLVCIEGEPASGKQTLGQYLLGRSPIAGCAFRRSDAHNWLKEIPANLAGFIYLDRVDLLSRSDQAVLLRCTKAMQDRPPGRDLLVASTQDSLQRMAARGAFLPELALRLTAVRFAIPPLRTHRQEIAQIAQCVLDHICARHDHRPARFDQGALECIRRHAWPGNLRELADALEAALARTAGDVIGASELALAMNGNDEQEYSLPEQASLALDDVIHRHVRHVLALNQGNKLRAARQLSISRSTLYRLLDNGTIFTR